MPSFLNLLLDLCLMISSSSTASIHIPSTSRYDHTLSSLFIKAIPPSPVDASLVFDTSNMKFTTALFSLLVGVAMAAPSTIDGMRASSPSIFSALF